MNEAITAKSVANAVGPYSHAVRSGSLVFVSAQAGQAPGSGRLVATDVAAQAVQALENLRQILEVAGKHLTDVVRVGIYLTDMADFPVVNDVYLKFFTAPFPARTTLCVQALPLGAAIEVDAIAL